MSEASVHAFLAAHRQGKLTQQPITAIGGHLFARAPAFEPIAHLGLDALTKQQVQGFVGKKLGGQGPGAIGKSYTVKHHAGHGFARCDFFQLIGHEPGIDQANQAEVLDDFRQNPSMVQALDAERFPLAPPLNQIRVWGHSAEDKWFLPLLHLLNAGSMIKFFVLDGLLR